MTPFKCYKLYVALKRHFSDEKYDFFKYRGKLRLNESSFENRKDKMLFYALANKSDPLRTIISNIAYNPNIYVNDLLAEEATSVATKYAKYQESFQYSFKEELKRYDRIDDAIKVVDGQYPPIVQDFVSRELSIDTISVVDKVIDGCEYWSSHLSDPLWTDINRQLTKYRPFVDINTTKYKTIIIDLFND